MMKMRNPHRPLQKGRHYRLSGSSEVNRYVPDWIV